MSPTRRLLQALRAFTITSAVFLAAHSSPFLSPDYAQNIRIVSVD